MNIRENLTIILTSLSLTACLSITKPHKPLQTEIYPGHEIYAKIECEGIKTIILERIYNKKLNLHEITSAENNSTFYYEDTNNGLNIIRELYENYTNCKIYYKNILNDSKLILLEKETLFNWTKAINPSKFTSIPKIDPTEIAKYNSKNETPESIEFKLKLLGLREMRTY